MKNFKIILVAVILSCFLGLISCAGEQDKSKEKPKEEQKNIQTTDTTGAKG